MSVSSATPETVYKPVPNWGKIPHGIWMTEATSVAVDSDDLVYVFNRGNSPMIVFDPDGNVMDMWGNDDLHAGMTTFTDAYGNEMRGWAGNRFMRPHMVRIDHEDNLWLADDRGHRIYKTDKKGNVLMTIGTGEASPRGSGEMFNLPTDIAVSPATGEIFISDGYGNSRIHRLDPQGNHILSWGESGVDHGQFSLPHAIAMLGTEKVIVCDRENHRIQVFTIDGEFVQSWHVHKAVSAIAGVGEDANVYIAEQGPPPVTRGFPNLGHRVSIWTHDGKMRNRIGNPMPGEEPDQFLWPHAVAVDSKGSIYVAEVSYVEVGRFQEPPREMMSLRKWERISG